MTISERLFFLLDKQGKHASDMCKYLEIGTSTTTNWKNRNTDPPAKYVAQICEFLDVTPEYLLTGKNLPNIIYRKDDEEWLNLIHQLPTEKQYEFKGEIKGYLKRLNEESVAADDSLKKTGTDKQGK